MKPQNEDEPQAGEDWTEPEVRLIVADYFEMLRAELLDLPYKKSHHRRALAAQLTARSDGAIEFKHGNVSAVLVRMGLPYIDGYKPARNAQTLLAQEVTRYLNDHPDFMPQMESAPLLNPNQPKAVSELSISEVIESPPEQIDAPILPDKPWLSRKGRRTDFVQRDAANRQLGKLGEQFVFDLERHRLKLGGRVDLAEKVVWASRDFGDGLGFDILSFDEVDETERLLEVKTTGSGKYFPFYVTSNEVRCSEDVPDQYHLCRVFDFARSPRLYVLRGALRTTCQLDPVVYRAMV